MFVELCDDVWELCIYYVIVQLARARIGVSAAAVRETERADVGRAGLVDDRLADHDGRVLLLESPRDVNAHLDLGPHGVDHESVAGVDSLERS